MKRSAILLIEPTELKTLLKGGNIQIETDNAQPITIALERVPSENGEAAPAEKSTVLYCKKPGCKSPGPYNRSEFMKHSMRVHRSRIGRPSKKQQRMAKR
jgi:hypothetical protein